MQPDHTANDFAQTSSLLPAPLEQIGISVPPRPVSVLARMTFCFAWLFGLEPFLAGMTDDAPSSARDHH